MHDYVLLLYKSQQVQPHDPVKSASLTTTLDELTEVKRTLGVERITF